MNASEATRRRFVTRPTYLFSLMAMCKLTLLIRQAPFGTFYQELDVACWHWMIRIGRIESAEVFASELVECGTSV